ncbi:MAG: hypothetical protein ACXWKO_04605 [Phenylobacterium sp.]
MSGGQPGLSRPVRTVFAAALAIYLAAAGWLVWRTSILEPYSDMYAWIARWRQWQADGDLGRYLWVPHNFHHLVWTFAVLGLDIRAFGGSGYLFLAVGVACLVGMAAQLGWFAAKAAEPGFRLVSGGVALALSAMGCDILDATADINTTYVHALIFAVAAILLAEAPGGRTRLKRGAALVCAVAAGLGSAAGLAVWPALLFGAWRRDDRRWAIVVLLVGAAFSGLYLLGDSSPTSGTTAHGGAIEAGELVLNYLALPWVRAAPPIGLPLGLVVLGVSSGAIFSAARRRADWIARAAGALILFSLTTAVLAGAARTGVTAPSLAPMRYAAFLIPLHVGLWVLALPYVQRAWARWPRQTQAAVVAVAILMVGHQAVMTVFAIRTADINLRLVADFRQGRRSPAMLTTIAPDLDWARAAAAQLRRDGLYQRELRRDPPSLAGSGISASSPDP